MAGLRLPIPWLIFYMHAVNSASINDVGNQPTNQMGSGSLSRYHVSLDSVRANEARERCNVAGGQLATINTKGDVKALTDVLRRELGGHVFWMGGKLWEDKNCIDKPFNSSCWYWNLFEEEIDFYDSTLIQFTEKATTEQSVDRSSFITIISGRTLKLDFSNGANLQSFICDYQPSSISSPRYYLAENSVRALDARDRCEFLGGQLATIQTKQDFKELLDFLGSVRTGVFWVGGRFSDENGCRGNPFMTNCWYWDVKQVDHDSYDSTVIQFSDEAFSDVRQVNPTSFITIIPGQNVKLDFDIESEYHPFICDLKPST